MTRQATMASAAADASEGPPRYLRDIARAAGLNLDRHRWAFTALGQYSSQKLLWYVFEPPSDPVERPVFVVKMPRTPAHNDRLERERDALVRLQELDFGDSETLPRVAFAGQHAGLAVLGETAVHGVPFETQTDFTPGCPRVRAALEWFTRLGEATADRTSCDAAQIADRLERLLRRFADRYPFSRDQQRFLAGQVEVIGRSTEAIPLVFQHGDAGCWNLLTTRNGRVAVLDWESAETGLPLWDVFYLFRSVVSRAARRSGRFGRRGRQQQLFLNDAGYGDLLKATVRQYCERVGLTPSLVEPLFHTCWMHRALKETTRLPSERLAAGREYRWLALCIEGREAPTLRRIFAARAPAPAIPVKGVCS